MLTLLILIVILKIVCNKYRKGTQKSGLKKIQKKLKEYKYIRL